MSTFHLSPEAFPGAAHLQVADLPRMLAFYRDTLGFREMARDDETVILSASGSFPAHLVLRYNPEARPRSPHTTGLYHIAFLQPDRVALARLLSHVIESRWPLTGASDHGVSEAIYLDDPEGNGLELYVDRPREQWPMQNGVLTMYTRRLNLDDLLAQAAHDTSSWSGGSPGAKIGHMHLQVADLNRAADFYQDILGLDMVVDLSAMGAAFLSVGGYHHHVGMNVWAGRGIPAAPPDATGLQSYTWTLPNQSALDELVDHLRSRDIAIQAGPLTGQTRILDADGIALDFVMARDA